MKKQRILSLCMASLLALSLVACNSPTDEQNSAQPTASTQPTTAPTPTPTPPPIPYTDVAEDSPYYDAVVWAFKNGIATDGETFEPANPCTRGQVITFMWRAAGSPEPETAESPFSDVSASDWFYQPALWAYENGVATGTAFNPGNPCTNGEALTFLWRAEGKPAAAVYSSPVALAASGAYYSRPAAWAETNGLFAGTDFDPAAPCSRAGLMTYLYWANVQWTLSEADKAVQAEFEQIIYDAQLYEVYGSGLCYADYVDVDGDGKVELLTVGSSENLVLEEFANDIFAYDVAITVYTGVNGHAEKLCEKIFELTWDECTLGICAYDGHVCFDYESLVMGIGPQDDFYKIENGSFTASDSVAMVMDRFADSNGDDISEAEYNAVINKYTDKKMLFYYHRYSGLSVKDRGLLPSPEEYEAALAKQWEAERDQVYAAVLNGDFSYFEGTYKGQIMEQDVTWTLNKNGLNGKQPFYITIYDNGVIHCDIEPGEYLHESGNIYEAGTHPDTHFGEYYELYPAGVAVSGYEYAYSSGNVRMHYINCDGGVMDGWFTKVS